MAERPGKVIRQLMKKRSIKRYNESRPERHNFYQTKEWRLLRSWYMKGHPLCEECLLKGINTAATMVDHIIEIADGGARLDESNLQALCFACHNRKTTAVRKRGRGGVKTLQGDEL